jgi:CreA protein
MKHAALALAFLAMPAAAEEIGQVGVDWVGNDIIIEALEDPKVEGVTCHVAYFERSFLDRLTNGNIFEDPSNTSIACRQTGPIVVGDIETDEEGEDVFSQGRSLFFKTIRVKRIYDEEHQTLVYLAHGRQVVEGSAKMSISTVPLYGADVRFASAD